MEEATEQSKSEEGEEQIAWVTVDEQPGEGCTSPGSGMGEGQEHELGALRAGQETWAGRGGRWSNWIWGVKLGHAVSNAA